MISLLTLGAFSVLSLGPVSAQQEQRAIEVQTWQVPTLHSLAGYYVSLWQNGHEIESCFSFCGFNITDGVHYQIAVSDYGNWCFAYWLSNTGNTSGTSRFQNIYFPANSGSITMFYSADYELCSARGGTSQLTVQSQDTSGNTVTGFYTVLYQDGTEVSNGFTPAAYTLSNGVAYVIQADSYGSCYFQQWSNGNTEASMSVSITSDTTVAAIYKCGASSSSITVNSISFAADSIFGYYVVLSDSNGNVLASGFTTHTFATTAGNSYSIRAESYGTCTFFKWGNGDTVNPLPFVATSGPQFFLAVYRC